MAMHSIDKALIKKIFNQLSGKAKEDEVLIPEVAIRGTGYMWCYEPTRKQMTRVSRGIKCYILDATLDHLDRIMVYTMGNDVILIEEEELIYTGFD